MVRTGLRKDVVAGLCVAGLLLPEAVAYAGLAHLPAVHGLTAALVGLAVYAVLGGSRLAIVAPTSSTATLAMAAVLSFIPGDPGNSAHSAAYVQGLMALCLLSGIFLSVLGVAGQGQLSSFVSRPVLRGFAFALALSIVVKQLPDALGLGVPATVASDPLHIALYVAQHSALWQWPSLLLAVGALGLLVFLRRWPNVPASLLVIVLAIGLGWALGHGATAGVSPYWASVGDIAQPPLRPSMPDLPMDQWLRSGELAFGLVMLVFAESWGSMRALALSQGDAPNPNRELLALGAANMVSAFFQGMPVGAGFSATAANAAAGAVSRKAGLVAMVALAAAAFWALPWVHYLPRPVLAVAVISALWHALSPAPVLAQWRMGRDRGLLVTAVLAVLLLGVLHGMLLAVGLSVLDALRRFSQPVLHELGELGESRNFVDALAMEGVVCRPGILVLRPEGPLFFGSAERVVAQVLQRVQGQAGIRTLILSLEESADLDSTSIDCLRELRQVLMRNGQTLLLARVKSDVRQLLERVDPAGLGDLQTMFWSVADAVVAAPVAQHSPAA
jgi:SulP family sulfate permease